MAEFSYLDKTRFDQYAPGLFSILVDNMSTMVPTGNSREEDFKTWFCAVKEGLEQVNRQIILITDIQGRLIGFFQYYTNETTFMMEEIQIVPDYQGKGRVFRDLYGYVIEKNHPNLTFVEAYAHKNNQKSNAILARLGLVAVGTNISGNSNHYRGNYSDFIKWYLSE